MFEFLHRLLNPHCPHCLAETRAELERIKSEEACPACAVHLEVREVLQRELEKSQREKEVLLAKLFEKPEPPAIIERELPKVALNPRSHNWILERQRLEAADRQKADEIRQAKERELGTAPSQPAETIADLEKVLGVEEK